MSTLKKPLGRIMTRGLALVLMTAVCLGVFAYTASAQTTYRISDGDTSTTLVARSSADVMEVLDQAGLDVDGSDIVVAQQDDGVTSISIHRMELVTISWDGTLLVCQAQGRTVGQLLRDLDLVMGPEDRLNHDLSEPATDGMYLELIRVTHVERTTQQTIPYGTLSRDRTRGDRPGDDPRPGR